MIPIAHLVVGLCFLGRLAAPGNRDMDDAASADGLPSLMVASLTIGRMVFGEDPLDALGLDVDMLVSVPWTGTLASLLCAFAMNRVVVTLALRPHLKRLVASGIVNPGGTHAAAAGASITGAGIIAAAMTGSQTFFEEFVFRGILFRGLVGLAGWAGFGHVARVWLGAIISSLSFGLVHFVPAARAVAKESWALPAYALVWSTALGGVFCLLDLLGGSLWPGWLIHWLLNYFVFLSDRISRAWEGGRA